MALVPDEYGGFYENGIYAPVVEDRPFLWNLNQGYVPPAPPPAPVIADYRLGPVSFDGLYLVRGNFRIPRPFAFSTVGSGPLEFRSAAGWIPVWEGAIPGYDARQDSDTQGSNERLRFDQGFSTAPAGTDIRTLQQYAISTGWTEPDRSNNDGTLGAMLSAVVPGVLAVVGGVAALGGLSGVLASGASGGLTAAEAAAADAAATTAGEFAVEAYTANAAATATAATSGVTNIMDGNLSDWLSSYSSDPGPDPFATTADVNAGWSYNGGYPGVDYYNTAGIGEAPSFTDSLNQIMGNVSGAVKAAAGAIGTISGALASTRNATAAPAPNFQRSAGSLNIGMLALIAAGFLIFKG